MSKPYCTSSASSSSANEIYDALLSDKKRRGGKITVILPRAVGDCMLYDMPVEDLKELLEKVI